ITHASPFFESALTGEWAETNVEKSNRNKKFQNSRRKCQNKSSRKSLKTKSVEQINESLGIFESVDQISNQTPKSRSSSDTLQPDSSYEQKQPMFDPSELDSDNQQQRIKSTRISLKDERAGPFQDLLMFIYPHLDCICTWQNVSELMKMSQKFDMPLLKRYVLNFLLSSVAGKPIEAMKIAEDHNLAELYRESSRFILDNWQGWESQELGLLISESLLKLERKRSWFLERVLKLGLVNPPRDYDCPTSCPSPRNCIKLVDEKWKSAWAATLKFGPPQPSSVYRHLRCLEPSLHSPALILPHTSCQQHSIRFFADLFDRMFSQFAPRGSKTHFESSSTSNNNSSNGNNAAGSSNSVIAPAGSAINSNGPGVGYLYSLTGMMNTNTSSEKALRKSKYFLYIELNENEQKIRKKIL
ncbi:expressed protein, partial [Phakopsora pachyrhizi]